MKVLLTGGSGLVGSHLADALVAANFPVRLLLRASSSTTFLKDVLSRVDVARGAVEQADSLDAALDGITHVIHCAGATKALNRDGYFAVNHLGTQHLVEAVNRNAKQIQRFVHISSLAAVGPATASRPSTEEDACQPVTDYGRSKLAGETVVRERCQVPWTILRPPGVYGPRDGEFLKLFKAVRAHLLPAFGGGRQELSLVYVKDLAKAALHVMSSPAAAGKTFNVAHAEVLNARQLGEIVAELLQTWTLPLRLPNFALWPVCAGQELINQISRRPNVINLQKYAELAAPGWVCRVDRLQMETGFVAPTTARAGLAETLAWYRQAGWLR